MYERTKETYVSTHTRTYSRTYVRGHSVPERSVYTSAGDQCIQTTPTARPCDEMRRHFSGMRSAEDASKELYNFTASAKAFCFAASGGTPCATLTLTRFTALPPCDMGRVRARTHVLTYVRAYAPTYVHIHVRTNHREYVTTYVPTLQPSCP